MNKEDIEKAEVVKVYWKDATYSEDIELSEIEKVSSLGVSQTVGLLLLEDDEKVVLGCKIYESMDEKFEDMTFIDKIYTIPKGMITQIDRFVKYGEKNE